MSTTGRGSRGAVQAVARERHSETRVVHWIDTMIDKLSERSEAWMSRWAAVVFPRARASTVAPSSTAEFLAGNLILSYFATLAVSLAYVLVRYSDVVHKHAQTDATSSLEYATKLFAAYVLMSFLCLLLVAAVAFAAYRIAGGDATFADHWARIADLFTYEPLAGAAVGLLWISDWQGSFATLGMVLFGVTRLWQAIAAFLSLRRQHHLRTSRASLAFAFGFIPAFAGLSVAMVAIGFVLVGSVIVKWWD